MLSRTAVLCNLSRSIKAWQAYGLARAAYPVLLAADLLETLTLGDLPAVMLLGSVRTMALKGSKPRITSILIHITQLWPHRFCSPCCLSDSRARAYFSRSWGPLPNPMDSRYSKGPLYLDLRTRPAVSQ